MRPSVEQRINNKNGAALVFVIMVLAVVCIFFGIMTTMFQGNLKQAKAQENDMRAYYLSLAGSDLVFAALIGEWPEAEIKDTLAYEKFNPVDNPSSSSITPLKDKLMLEEGDVDITVTGFDDSNGERWVEIKADSKLDDSAASKTMKLQFQLSNPWVQKRS